VCVSDLHCGALVGLTPGQYNSAQSDHPRDRKLEKVRGAVWDWYRATLRRLGRPDLLISNGDAVDGPGHRSGGSELLVPSLTKQADMAAECLLAAKAANIVMTYGTTYHVADPSGNIDLEDAVADKVSADKIGAHEWVRLAGTPTVFDFKHHIGRGETNLKNEQLWNTLWAEAGAQPRGDVLVRSHLHCAKANLHLTDRKRWGIVTPAMCGFGSKFGSRICTKLVHVGLTWWRVGRNGVEAWDIETASLAVQRAGVLEI
jgi:hypothetical protein